MSMEGRVIPVGSLQSACGGADLRLNRCDEQLLHHAAVQVMQPVAADRSLRRFVRGQQHRLRPTQRDRDDVLPGHAVERLVVLDLEEHAVQVHRIRNHLLVDEGDTAAPVERGADRSHFTKLSTVARPDIAFHVARHLDGDLAQRRASVGLRLQGDKVAHR